MPQPHNAAPTPELHNDNGAPAKIEAVHQVVDYQELTVVFQPIVDLRSRKVFGYEALARCASPAFDSIPDLYRTATQAGRVGELGRLHRIQAVRECPHLPLFLNVFPNEFDHGWLVRPDDPVFRHKERVFLEITESVPLSHFDQCNSVLVEIRKKGLLLAIDDLGAGYSNLKYIADLEPHVVKLDRELVAGIRRATRQERLLQSIVRLAQEMGAKVVAEGIETSQELEAVQRAGADYGQGYLFARPAFPPPDVVWPDSGNPSPRAGRRPGGPRLVQVR